MYLAGIALVSLLCSNRTNKLMILWTSDVHCNTDDLEYVKNLKKNYKEKGYKVILLDDGDFIYDDTISKEDETHGEKYIKQMNETGYDIAIPGNCEFNFGAKQFEKLRSHAKFKYICCNVFHNGNHVMNPYVIKKINGKKIAFIGFTAPWNTEKHKELFADADGNVRYQFLCGEDAYWLLQTKINEVRRLGADYVYLFAHAGLYEDTEEYSSQYLIENTYGIDVCVDAHTHDHEVRTYTDAAGRSVMRIAVGDRLSYVGYSMIDLDNNVMETGMLTIDEVINQNGS